MPGLAGFTTQSVEPDTENAILAEMQRLLTHGVYCKRDQLFCDEYVSCTRSYIDILQRAPQPYAKGDLRVWLDGETYNRDAFAERLGVHASSDPELLAQIFDSGREASLLSELDGFYAAVVYDAGRRKLHLLSDRYGLKHLYWVKTPGGIAWGSEVKGFLSLPTFRPTIDRASLDQFLQIGYLLENRTWFEQAKLLSPGTTVTLDLATGHIEERQYWWWDRIKAVPAGYDDEELAQEMGRLFRNAVTRRYRDGEDVGMLLSGGLDSRAILAAITSADSHFTTVTFGKRGCLDERIARKVATKKGVKHKLQELSATHWLEPRISNVWRTDGQLDLMHMHGIEALDDLRAMFKINLSGFLGDVVLGGSFLKRPEHAVDSCERNNVAQIMNCPPEILEGFSRYEGLRKSDFYMHQNRGRRFIAAGLAQTRTALENRTPFYDSELFEFAYSLPDRLRYGSRIYQRMLLASFPELYRNIPWANTGVPINWPHWMSRGYGVVRRLRGMARSGAARFGVSFSNPDAYSDYSNWLRAEPARSFIEAVLVNEEARSQAYLPRKTIQDTWRRHLGGENHADLICRYLTFEIWLQQVYEGKYRDDGYRMDRAVIA